jgi:hypothetical protein
MFDRCTLKLYLCNLLAPLYDAKKVNYATMLFKFSWGTIVKIVSNFVVKQGLILHLKFTMDIILGDI